MKVLVSVLFAPWSPERFAPTRSYVGAKKCFEGPAPDRERLIWIGRLLIVEFEFRSLHPEG